MTGPKQDDEVGANHRHRKCLMVDRGLGERKPEHTAINGHQNDGCNQLLKPTHIHGVSIGLLFTEVKVLPTRFRGCIVDIDFSHERIERLLSGCSLLLLGVDYQIAYHRRAGRNPDKPEQIRLDGRQITENCIPDRTYEITTEQYQEPGDPLNARQTDSVTFIDEDAHRSLFGKDTRQRAYDYQGRKDEQPLHHQYSAPGGPYFGLLRYPERIRTQKKYAQQCHASPAH